MAAAARAPCGRGSARLRGATRARACAAAPPADGDHGPRDARRGLALCDGRQGAAGAAPRARRRRDRRGAAQPQGEGAWWRAARPPRDEGSRAGGWGEGRGAQGRTFSALGAARDGPRYGGAALAAAPDGRGLGRARRAPSPGGGGRGPRLPTACIFGCRGPQNPFGRGRLPARWRASELGPRAPPWLSCRATGTRLPSRGARLQTCAAGLGTPCVRADRAPFRPSLFGRAALFLGARRTDAPMRARRRRSLGRALRGGAALGSAPPLRTARSIAR